MPLAARSSLEARRIIHEAFKGLEKIISPSEAKDFNDTTLQNVQDAALEIESILAARQSLRNMRRLSPLFEGIKCYAETIEVLCNGTPYLPWIWAPIKLILKVSSDYTDAFEKIIKAYSGIAESLPRFQIISYALRNDKEMQQVLAVFYADILTFHKEAYIFVRRSGWRTLFLTSWGRFQRRFDSTLEDLRKHGRLIDDTASAINLSETVKMSQNLRAWRQENLDKLKSLEDEETAKQYQSIIGCLKIDETEQLAIFDAISSEGNKYEGTCDWVSRHIHIREWLKETPATDFVWVQGNPGTGKSVIATQLVKFLQSSGRAMVTRHFCTYTHLSSIQYETILRSLLVQLMRTSSDLIAHAYAEFVIGKKLPTSQSLEQLLLAFGGAISPIPSESRLIYLVIDGLDECDPDQQGRIANLLEKLRGLRSSASSVFKILLCSRRTLYLEKRLRKRTVQVVSMTNEKGSIEPAIRTYAKQRLRAIRYRLFQMGLTDLDLRDISINIARKADGMFLWARLVLDYLSTNILSSRDEVRGAVDMLPVELGEFYARILAQLTSRFDQRSVERLRSILGWIAFAKRPLTKAEMRSALAFSWGDHMVEEAVPRHIFDFGAPLLEEHPDTTYSFVHISVKEYLQTPGCILFLDQSAAIHEQATATITCLVSGFWIFSEQLADDTRILRIVKGLHGLHIYANQFWLECLLDAVSTGSGLVHGSILHRAAQELANSLRHQPSTLTYSTSGVPESTASRDSRLQCLKEHSAIYEMARKELGERVTRARLLMTEDGGTPKASLISSPNNFQSLLLAMQSSIRDILTLSAISGVSPEDLDRFKKEFRTSAFTCRFPNCPRAALGFPDEKSQCEHETRHTQLINCVIIDCQYPPFVSTRALRDHVLRCHQPQRTIRKRIRRESGGNLSPGVMIQERTALDSMEDLSSNPPNFISHTHFPLPQALPHRPSAEVPPALHQRDIKPQEKVYGDNPVRQLDNDPKIGSSNQHPAKVTTMPHQSQPLPVGVPNPTMMHARLGQLAMQITQTLPTALMEYHEVQRLTDRDRPHIKNFALKRFVAIPEPLRDPLREKVLSQLAPQHAQQIRAMGLDPLMIFFEHQSLMQVRRSLAAQSRQGMAPHPQQVPQPHNQVNPALMNPPGQSHGVTDGQLLPPNLEAIRNEQQMGLRAQEAGQVVVPASSGPGAPGRNATPGPMINHIHTAAAQQGPNQTPRPPPSAPPGFHHQQVRMETLNPTQVQAQAQVPIRGQGPNRHAQGQPGGLGGLPTASQSPAINNMAAPMQQSPAPMAQGMRTTLNPSFNHHANARPPSMQGNISASNPAMAAMLGNLNPNSGSVPGGLPESQIKDMMAKWEQQRNTTGNAQQLPKHPQVSGMPAQHQLMGAVNTPNQPVNIGNAQQPGGMMPPGMQAGPGQPQLNGPQNAQTATMAALTTNPWAIQMVDNLDIPADALNALRGIVQPVILPPNMKKWVHLKAWHQTAGLPPHVQDKVAQVLTTFQQQQIRQL